MKAGEKKPNYIFILTVRTALHKPQLNLC